MDYDKMTNEELCVLYQQTHDDSIYEYFVARNEKLIYYFIGNFLRKISRDEEEDVVQHCKYAMWEAMQRFDGSRELKFSGYFYYYAKKGIENYLRDDHFNLVHIPAYARGRKYRETHIGDYVRSVMNIDSLDAPLDTNTTTDDVSLYDCIADESIMSETEYMDVTSKYAPINQILSKLRPREQRCILLYFGFTDGKKMTLEEIGQMYGITRERVRQIIAAGLKKVKPELKKYRDELYN